MTTVIDFPQVSKPIYGPKAKIGIVIQARMTSKRFPGKSMALLNGKCVLEHVIERAKLIRAPFYTTQPIKVIIAVPDTPESEPMLKLADDLRVDNFCGSEGNVLERYYAAAKFHKLDVIVRITADCPLIDPKVCSEVLQLLMWRKIDYTANWLPERTFPKGLDCEAFTFECLEATWSLVKDNYNNILPHQKYDLERVKYDQEHVTPFMIRQPEIKKAFVQCTKGNFSNENLCIDFPSDIKRIEALMKKSSIIVPTKPVLLVKASA